MHVHKSRPSVCGIYGLMDVRRKLKVRLCVYVYVGYVRMVGFIPHGSISRVRLCVCVGVGVYARRCGVRVCMYMHVRVFTCVCVQRVTVQF
jgi:hypothetical protein